MLRDGGRLAYAIFGRPGQNPWITSLARAIDEAGQHPAGDPFGPDGRSSPSPSPIVQSVALAADPCPALWRGSGVQRPWVGKVRALDVTGRRAGAVARGRVVPLHAERRRLVVPGPLILWSADVWL